MTLDRDDKKEITKIMQGVVDVSVAPRFEKVEGELGKIDHKLDVTMEMTAKNTEDIGTIKEDIVEIQDNIKSLNEKTDDLQDSSNRIETLAKSEIKYVDDLSGRVLKLETKKV